MPTFRFPRQMYLLMLLAADQGSPIKGRVRLQKLVFLLKKKIIDERGLKLSPEHYQFVPYNYGPYSYEVMDDIEFLEDMGLVEVKRGVENPQVNEEYRITEKGKSFVKHFLENAIKSGDTLVTTIYSEIEKLKKKYNKLPLEKLLKYVYIEYPEFTERSVIRSIISK